MLYKCKFTFCYVNHAYLVASPSWSSTVLTIVSCCLFLFLWDRNLNSWTPTGGLVLQHVKMLFVTKPAKYAYIVNRGYANFEKMIWMLIICIPRLKIKEWKFSEIITFPRPLPERGCRSTQKFNGKVNYPVSYSHAFTFPFWETKSLRAINREWIPLNSFRNKALTGPLIGNGMKTWIISEDFWCLILNLRTCTIVLYHFSEISKPPVIEPIGSIIRYSILIMIIWPRLI